MANKKITELAAASTLDGTEVMVLVQGGATKQALLSALFADMSIATAAINTIGKPGAQGFGVGICPALPAGYAPVAGYSDPASDNYGNYQYSDGSVMCWIPAFYYRLNDARNPTYAAHMRALHATCRSRIGAAREAGIPIYAGTDAGGMIAHGRIADEVEALKGIGMSPTDALGAACWDARRWLGGSLLEHGAPADLVCFAEDPRSGPGVLGSPDLVMLRGRVY